MLSVYRGCAIWSQQDLRDQLISLRMRCPNQLGGGGWIYMLDGTQASPRMPYLSELCQRNEIMSLCKGAPIMGCFLGTLSLVFLVLKNRVSIRHIMIDWRIPNHVHHLNTNHVDRMISRERSKNRLRCAKLLAMSLVLFIFEHSCSINIKVCEHCDLIV